MDCHSNHSVFLRADGSLACWDDAGSKLTLTAYQPDIDHSKDVVFGEIFSGIRDSLRKGEMPFPQYCQGCMVLASGACFNPLWAEKKEILIFQIEPSIACRLECPGCMTLAVRKARHGPPWNLDIGIFEKYLSDFKADGVSIRTIDFQGHGEPLINRDVWKMAGLAKSYFPDANITMCTNAHGRYDPSQVHSGIDEVMFAIDGVDQQSFEQNRVRGDFAKAYTFMKSFCQGAANEGRHIKTIWKYILFDCNDSPEQLLRAQELAAEAGVQEIHFVNTQLGLKASKVFTLEQIPRLNNGVKVTISDYLSNFHDILHGVDKARFALYQKDPDAAKAHLLFAMNMIRRRFECIEPDDDLPASYQALVYEIDDLSRHALLDPETRSQIAGGLHIIQDKLTIGVLGAKDLVIEWKTEELLRLSRQLNARRRTGLVALAKSIIKGCLNKLESTLSKGSVPAKNAIIQRKAQKVFQLARQIDQRPGPGVSVI